MANTRVSDLSAGGAFVSTDEVYVVETAGVGGVKKTGAQLAEYARDTIAAFCVAGSNIGIVHDDVNDTLTFSYTGVVYTDADVKDFLESSAVIDIAVKSDAVLFSHDDVTPGSGNCRVFVNKDAASDTSSVLLQTAASGRAEFGLTGDDDFHVRVSADGSAWMDAIIVDKDDGAVRLPVTTANKLQLQTTSDSFNPVITYLDESPGQARIGAFNYVNDTGSAAGQIAFFFNKASPATQYLRFFVNNVTIAEFYSGGTVFGGATGGQKGAGTINAVAVYDDNTLLTCYVFDQALDGAMDSEKWDAKVPDRVIRSVDVNGNFTGGGRIGRLHEPMRRFAAQTRGKYNPLTLDGYARHWQQNRHLSSMPDEATFDPESGMAVGDWIQRLVETVEIQAVLIEQLNVRLKVLER